MLEEYHDLKTFMIFFVQHGLLLPVLVHHLRMHAALDDFEKRIGYTFKNRNLLQVRFFCEFIF